MIRVHREALSRLEALVREGMMAMDGRGLEVGGVMVGMDLGGEAAELLITDFIPVSIEHEFGLAYRPSEADIPIFQAVSSRPHGKAIGYFRSQVRNGLSVRAEDRRILRHLFPDAECCFLLIRTGARVPSKVELYRVEAGLEPVLFKQFPLEAAAGGDASANPKAAPQFSLPARHRLAEVEPLSDITSETLGRKNTTQLWTVASILAALAVMVLAYSLGRHSGAATNRSGPQRVDAIPRLAIDSKIGLSVTQHGELLEIRWNPAHFAVRTAVRGTLIITDGPAGDIGLDAATVRSGLYVYKPNLKSVHVLLMIYQADGSFVGDTRDFTRTSVASEPYRVSPQPEPKEEAVAPALKIPRPTKGRIKNTKPRRVKHQNQE